MTFTLSEYPFDWIELACERASAEGACGRLGSFKSTARSELAELLGKFRRFSTAAPNPGPLSFVPLADPFNRDFGRKSGWWFDKPEPTEPPLLGSLGGSCYRQNPPCCYCRHPIAIR
jgi:hypothetical protein